MFLLLKLNRRGKISIPFSFYATIFLNIHKLCGRSILAAKYCIFILCL